MFINEEGIKSESFSNVFKLTFTKISLSLKGGLPHCCYYALQTFLNEEKN